MRSRPRRPPFDHDRQHLVLKAKLNSGLVQFFELGNLPFMVFGKADAKAVASVLLLDSAKSRENQPALL